MAATAAVALLLLQQLWSAEAQVWDTGLPQGCPESDKCGNVNVSFPFGIRAGCSLRGFQLICDTTRNPPRLMIGNGTLQVLEISLANSTVRATDIAGAVNITNANDGGLGGNGTWGGVGDGDGSPYVVSESRNKLVVTGCNTMGILFGKNGNAIVGCSPFCSINDYWASSVTSISGDKCSGVGGCCQMPIPIGRPNYHVKLSDQVMSGQVPNAVRIAEMGWFEEHAAELLNKSLTDTSLKMPVPVVLEWAVASYPVILSGVPQYDNSSCPTNTSKSACKVLNSQCHNAAGNYRSGYVCRCQEGYEGNPYLLPNAGGCQDIDECKLSGTVCFGECINTPGSFFCQCPHGTSGNATIGDCRKSYTGLSVGIGVGSGAGLLVVALGAFFLTRKIKRRRARMLRLTFFRQNRGHLLQQLKSKENHVSWSIPASEGTSSIDESTRQYSLEEEYLLSSRYPR
ncbi:hypothetical protein ABZP36_035902 [Zizania latifolia]